MLDINLIQNVQITKSHYVKLTFGYIKNSIQKIKFNTKNKF